MDRRKAIKKTALIAGATLSSSTLISLLQSCQEQDRLQWSPVFFTEEQAANVSEITEMILPRTQTPGAKDLHVDVFVDLLCKETLSPSDQKHVLEGYEKFATLCQIDYKKAFTEMDHEERSAIMTKLGEQTNTFNPSVWGSTLGVQEPLDFYRRVKQFTLIGYFTSEEIGRNVLRYDPIPGKYQGCIPYKGENSWTL